MLDAYLDESGIHDEAEVCVVAGYFGGRGQWKRFETDWKRVLKQFGVPMDRFHAKDLLPYPKGFFHGWDSDRYSGFLNAIGATIAACKKIHPVSVAIVVQDFNSFSLDERKFFTGADIRDGKITSSGCPGKPYFVPFQHCVRRVCDYAPTGGRAHFFFGVDRPFCGYATKLFAQIKNGDLRGMKWFEWKERLGNAAFPSAKQTAQLQAADLLVNLTYRHILDAGDNVGTLRPRGLLATCIQNARSIDDFFLQNRANLEASLRNAAETTRALKEAGL